MLTTLLTTQHDSGAARTPGRSRRRSFIVRKAQQPFRETALVSAAKGIRLGKCLSCSQVAFQYPRYRDNGMDGRVSMDSEGTGPRGTQCQSGVQPRKLNWLGILRVQSHPLRCWHLNAAGNTYLEPWQQGCGAPPGENVPPPCEWLSTDHVLLSVDSSCALALRHAYF